MSYKMSKGERKFGDLDFEDDDNTKIDFDQDYIALVTSGSNTLVVSGSLVGIGTATPAEVLTLNATEPTIRFEEGGTFKATIGVNSSDNILIENKTINKHIVFKVNDQNTVREGLRLNGAVPEVVINEQHGINGDNSLVDFRVESETSTHMLFVDGSADKIGIKTNQPEVAFDINDNAIRIRNSSTPSSAGDFGVPGEIRWDANYIYVCVSIDTWKRVALSTWQTIYSMMKEWQDYLASVKEANTFKNRIRSYISDRNKMLGKGGNKNSPPYTKKMGSHVTFDKQLEEELEVDIDSFKINDNLDPQIWNDEKLDPEIRKKLIKIANDFIDGLPVRVKVEDITLTGSLANYNWSRYSDVDLHIIVNFSSVDENEELVKGFFDGQRMRWNDVHDITIKEYDVEIYVENSGEDHRSTGVYSIMNDDWIKHPEYIEQNIDTETAKKKAVDIDSQTTSIQTDYDEGEYDKVMRNVDRLKNKIRNMRSAGLESELMEYSPENIAFKMLRRAKVLNKLTKLKYNAYDKMNTLDD